MSAPRRPRRHSLRRRQDRATVVVVCEGRVALIRRRRRAPARRGDAASTEKFWVLPGGGIERGETPRDAARRELAEETGLHIALAEPVAVLLDASGRRHHLFVAHLDGPRPTLSLSGPELARHCAANSYEPRWVRIDKTPRSLRGALSTDLLALLVDGMRGGVMTTPTSPGPASA